MKKTKKVIILMFSIMLMFIETMSVSAAVGKTSYKYIWENNADKNYISKVRFLSCSKTLYRGQTGKQIEILQERLNEKMHCNLNEKDSNGKYLFGYKTEWCVKQFQAANDLEVDGRVGPKTCPVINSARLPLGEDYKNYIVIEKKNYANVRKTASSSGKDIGNAKTGTIYEVLDYKTVSGVKWYQVKHNGTKGWISGKDILKTAVSVDISDQTLKYIKDGKLLLTAPVVTGRKGAKDTPKGVYVINKKVNGLTLRPNSAPPEYVSYWMALEKSLKSETASSLYGLHDSTKRSVKNITDKTTYTRKDKGTRGTSSYNPGGSNGCVNMLLEDAGFLYKEAYRSLRVYIKA